MRCSPSSSLRIHRHAPPSKRGSPSPKCWSRSRPLHILSRADEQTSRSPLAFGRGDWLFGALSQSFLEGHGAAMLFQQVAEGLVRKLLKRLHAIARQQRQRLPYVGFKRDQLAPGAMVGSWHLRGACYLVGDAKLENKNKTSGNLFRFHLKMLAAPRSLHQIKYRFQVSAADRLRENGERIDAPHRREC